VVKSIEATESIAGSVERITFHSEETGFCVLRVSVKGHRGLVTVVGFSPSLTLGERIECQGHWHQDPKFGLQFKAEQLKCIQPNTTQGIEKYLSSGMVKGIGEHFAKKLTETFGDTVFDVIEKTPEALLTLEGIGTKRQQQITSAWSAQKGIRSIMVFLQGHGVGTSRAVRIYKTYGEAAIEMVKANPYRLTQDIRGIGFKTADTLAQRLGIPQDSDMRACAGVRYVLKTLCAKGGHCAIESDKLLAEAITLLEIPEALIQQVLTQEEEKEHIQAELINDQPCYYPMRLYRAEVSSAENLSTLMVGSPPWGKINTQISIPPIEKKTGLTFSSSQRAALQKVLQHKVSIITGGPGVGKTTLVQALLWLLKPKNLNVSLCAPTGRAAKRLTEITGLYAKTIHRLLVFDPSTYGFQHNADYPLPLDVLIVDEASMLDLVLFNHLLNAISMHAAIIFVGDVDQLPSVGAGAVLSDLIASEQVATVRLTEIFRQAQQSNIVLNAHRVNKGQMPLTHTDEESDYFTLYEETPEAIQKTVMHLVTEYLPKACDCHPSYAIQVLAPMHRGPLGCLKLNALLQHALNPTPVATITRFGLTYAVGDKVIQGVNNYDKKVFNGDIGFIDSIDKEEDRIIINFDDQLKTYKLHECDEISLAYAITIHKSQGSEFPIVVMPLATQHYMLLARNLLYTGLTRGKKLVILIGQKKAVSMAVYNTQSTHRLTKLAERLIND